MTKAENITLGAEIEKPISNFTTGKPHKISQKFFSELANETGGKIKHSDIEPETMIGVEVSKVGDMGLDNAFNLQETASCVVGSLEELNNVLKQDLSLVQKKLKKEGACVINASIHPLGSKDKKTYNQMVAPKGVYEYIHTRGWDHGSGIDAKAQNSPCTGVDVENAAKAQTTVLGAGAAFIALSANSPIANGKETGYKESRTMMWEAFMRNSISEGDRTTAKFPDQPFDSLAQYFSWMFGEGTNIHFVMSGETGYKTFGDGAILIKDNPPVLEYLKMREASGRMLKTGKQVVVTPHLSHLETMQFAQFSGARIRYQFDHDVVDKDIFLKAQANDQLEELLSDGGMKSVYIEGRDAGANFPDRSMWDRNPKAAKSVIMTPSALQLGLLRNLSEAHNFVRSKNWQHLGELRLAAAKYALADDEVYEFTKSVVEIAYRGLDEHEKGHLEHALDTIRTRETGADRLLNEIELGSTLQQAVINRNVVIKP